MEDDKERSHILDPHTGPLKLVSVRKSDIYDIVYMFEIEFFYCRIGVAWC